jgi:hypothetical protein
MRPGCGLGFLRLRSVKFGGGGKQDSRCMRLDVRLTSRIVVFVRFCCLVAASLLLLVAARD